VSSLTCDDVPVKEGFQTEGLFCCHASILLQSGVGLWMGCLDGGELRVQGGAVGARLLEEFEGGN